MKVIVLEIQNVTDEQIQKSLVKAFIEFCNKNKGAKITANTLTEEGQEKVLSIIYEEDKE